MQLVKILEKIFTPVNLLLNAIRAKLGGSLPLVADDLSRHVPNDAPAGVKLILSSRGILKIISADYNPSEDWERISNWVTDPAEEFFRRLRDKTLSPLNRIRAAADVVNSFAYVTATDAFLELSSTIPSQEKISGQSGPPATPPRAEDLGADQPLSLP